MDWITHKKLLLKKHGFQKAFKESQPEFQIAKAVIDARIKNGLSQKELAHRLQTKQSVISRVENAKTMPSLAWLKKIATELGVSFQVKINPS